MNVNVSGSSHITAGEYEKISISGSAKLDGVIRCQSFSCSGSVSGESQLEVDEAFKVSGSCGLQGSLRAQEIKVSGAMKMEGNCTAAEGLKVSGGFKCGGDVKCGELKISGGAKVEGGIEAESVRVSGRINCGGLLNAETIEIERCTATIGEIGGGSIRILHSDASVNGILFGLFRAPHSRGIVQVPGGIEGDEIVLEGVQTPTVRGRVVAIGPDCKIDLVQYSETIEIDPSATVKKYEKV